MTKKYQQPQGLPDIFRVSKCKTQEGVGFRYRAYYSAVSLGLTGWVRNEWDGSVEMEVQGSEEAIQKLLSMLHSERFISIEYFEQTVIPPIDKERKFRVR